MATVTQMRAAIHGDKAKATRESLLAALEETLDTTPLRDIKVVDVARKARTSSATFYAYFTFEQALTELVPTAWTEPIASAPLWERQLRFHIGVRHELKMRAEGDK